MMIALVNDVFFIAKIGETAKRVGVEVVFKQEAIEVQNASLVIVDLEAFFSQVPLLQEQNPGAEIIGFLSHVNTDLKKQAEAIGVTVMTKNDFSARLREILTSGRSK